MKHTSPLTFGILLENEKTIKNSLCCWVFIPSLTHSLQDQSSIILLWLTLCFQAQNHARRRRDFRNVFKIGFKLHSEEWVSTARNTVLCARVKMDFDLVLKCLKAIVRHNYLSTPIVPNQLYQLENNQVK